MSAVVRRLFALLMLFALARGGGAPACARPTHPAMAHYRATPEDCRHDAASHDGCLGCGIELPDPPRVALRALVPVALSPVSLPAPVLVGTMPRLPLPPPRALV